MGADTGVNIPGGFVVQGVVSSVITGGPLSGATVMLVQHGALVETVQTSGDGSYSFDGVEAGVGYTVSVDAVTGYLGKESDTFTVSGITTIPIVLDRQWPAEGTIVATFSGYPNNIAVTPDGAIYLTLSGTNKIQKIAPGGTTAEDYAGTNATGVADGSLASATFNALGGIAVSADGTEVYATDYMGLRVRKITSSQVLTIAGSGSSGGFSGDGGDAKQAILKNPFGVAVDAAGNVYVADSGNGRVRKISAGGTISTIAGGGDQTQAEGEALSARLSSLMGIAVDSQGNVYITENNRVRKITGSVISTVIGAAVSGLQLERPRGITVDAAGTVYVADMDNHRIVKVLADGTASVLAGGNGVGTGQFKSPSDLAIGPDGALYIGDAFNNRIMKY